MTSAMSKSTLKILSQFAVIILTLLALVELALAIWTVAEHRYKSLAYSLADVGYIVRRRRRESMANERISSSRISGY